jgi:hypothetical protein
MTRGSNNTSCPGKFTNSFNSKANSSSSSSAGSSSSSAGSSSRTATATIGYNDNGVHSSTSSNSTNGARLGAIAGGVVGAILLLGLLFVFFRRRNNYGRHRRVGILDNHGSVHPSNSEVSQYPPPPAPYPLGAYDNTTRQKGQPDKFPGRKKVETGQIGNVPVSGVGGVIELPPAYPHVPTHL